MICFWNDIILLLSLILKRGGNKEVVIDKGMCFIIIKGFKIWFINLKDFGICNYFINLVWDFNIMLYNSFWIMFVN